MKSFALACMTVTVAGLSILATPALAQPAKGESVVEGGPIPSMTRSSSDTDWPMYNKDYGSQRFTPLQQINAQNVASLKEVCRIKLAELTSFHSGPILVDGVMYVTTARDTVTTRVTYVAIGSQSGTPAPTWCIRSRRRPRTK